MGRNQLELDDLPEDCIAEILKKIETSVHRNDARLVCKFWQLLINSDSSSERYLVNQKTTDHGDDSTKPEFRNFIPQFLNFTRKKISFRFDGVDLRDTEDFWTEKGAHIIELNFENWCLEIPLEHVISECIRLREMFISYSTDEIIDALESLTDKQFCNYFLIILTIDPRLFGGINMEIAIRFVGLISKVFPRIRKITLWNFEYVNGQFEELSKMLVHLKCELELNTTGDFRILLDSLSKTPISVRKVFIDNWTMLPYEYYRNLEDIIYCDGSSTFQLSQLENTLSQYPMLQTLDISVGTLINDLKKPIGNRLKRLVLHLLFRYSFQKFTMSPVFLETFQFLKIFRIENVSHSSFTDILLNMEHLEDLVIRNFIAVDEECEMNKEQEVVIVHENLKKLIIPAYFLSRTRTIYHFDNLMKITLKPIEFSPNWELQDVDEILQLIQCPNLEDMWFEVEMMSSKAIDSLWLKNVMSMFPKLEKFSFDVYGSVDSISEDQKLGLHQICPKLDIYDQHSFEKIIRRSLRKGWDKRFN